MNVRFEIFPIQYIKVKNTKKEVICNITYDFVALQWVQAGILTAFCIKKALNAFFGCFFKFFRTDADLCKIHVNRQFVI